MTTTEDLDHAYQQLRYQLDDLQHTSTVGAERATELRTRTAAMLAAMTAHAAGRQPSRCPRHRGQPAHNCAPCRGETLGTQ